MMMISGSIPNDGLSNSNIVWKRSMMSERKRDWNFLKDRRIYGESNVWSTAQR